VKNLLWAAAMTAALFVPGRSLAQSVTHVSPMAVPPGQSTKLVFHGDKLNGAQKAWLSFNAQVQPAPDNDPKDAAKVAFMVNVPTDVPAGIYAARIATGKGVSNVRLVMVDDLATIAENGQNKSAASAQELNLPVAVDGVAEAESWDYYKFAAAKGQRVSIEAVARRLGSPLDPVIRLLDSKGRDVAFSDDDPGIGVDSRLSLAIPADGVYTIEIRDIQYAGSANHRYRLRVGDFPLVTAPYPLSVKKGASASLEMAGPAVEGIAALTMNVPQDLAASTMAVPAKYTNGQGAGVARVLVDDLPPVLEVEPNDKREEATPAAVPAIINGRFAAARDRDHWRFEAKKGQRLQFTGITRSIGSPSFLFLQLLGSDGNKVAEAEDPGVDEVRLNHTFAADGVYTLMVEELTYGHGPQHVYGLRVEQYRPGFTLALDFDKFDPPQGGVFVTKVTAARRDYNGPIALEIVGVEGVTLANNTIAEGKNDTTMRVTLPASLTAGQLVNCQIVGKAKIGEQEVRQPAHVMVALAKAYPGMVSLPSEITQTLALGVGPVFPDFFKLSLEPASVLLPQLVGTNTFKVKVEKLNKFDDAVALKIEGLPQGVTAEVKPIEKGKAETVVTLKGPETLAAGEHRFKITGSATFTNQPKSVTLSDVVLKVGKPLAVQAAAAGTVAPGGKQKIKVSITRFGDHKSPVTLAWKNLPKGVTAPSDEVPEGKNEIEIELVAAADAGAIKAENVAVVAVTRFKDQDLVVESAPFVLEVKN
jgi:hypothetical protein